VRVHSEFNSILGLPGASVSDVEVRAAGIVVTVVLAPGAQRCSCGRAVASRYDQKLRRWRHLDVAGRMLWIEAMVPRVWCRDCDRVGMVPVGWARLGSRFTLEFEQQVAWLAQRMDIASVARLMRCGWDAIGRIVSRVVADHLDDDAVRFGGLRRIGVDEVSYKKGRHFLTLVVDHDRRRVVWVGVGRSKDTLKQFYDRLGPDRCRLLESVTMDGSPAYRTATEESAPQARICLDTFHIMQWVSRALDEVFAASRVTGLREELSRITGTSTRPGRARGRGWATARHAVRAGQERLTGTHRQVLALLRRERAELFRAWQLKEELRDLFTVVAPEAARAYLREWIRRAGASGIGPIAALALKLSKLRELIIAGIEERLTNSRLEGTNTRIRVIQRRGYGMPRPDSIITMIYLCCGGLEIALPTRN
jgi:transposase